MLVFDVRSTYLVVVVEHNEAAQAKMASQRPGLGGHALLQVSGRAAWMETPCEKQLLHSGAGVHGQEQAVTTLGQAVTTLGYTREQVRMYKSECRPKFRIGVHAVRMGGGGEPAGSHRRR